MRIKKLNPNSARSRLRIDGFAGKFPMNCMAPIESASPNIKSDSP